MFLVLKYAAKPYETNAEEKAAKYHWTYGALLEGQLLPHWMVVVLVIIMVVCEIRNSVGSEGGVRARCRWQKRVGFLTVCGAGALLGENGSAVASRSGNTDGYPPDCR